MLIKEGTKTVTEEDNMNGEWTEAAQNEAFLIRKEKLWDFILTVFAVVCIFPMSILCIIHTYQNIVPYAKTTWEKLMFYVVAVILLAAAGAALHVLYTAIQKCIKTKGSILKCEYTVSQTWKESNGKMEMEYYGFSYTDPFTGDKKKYKASNIAGDEHVNEGDTVIVYGQQQGESLAILKSMAVGIKPKMGNESAILTVIANLAFVGLANGFLYRQYGPLAIYFRLMTYIVLIATAVMVLLFGVLNLKAVSIVAGLIIAVIFMKFNGPDVLSNIAADLKEGPVTIHANAKMTQFVTKGRTRRGGTTSRTSYYMEFSDQILGDIEVSPTYYRYYESSGNVFTGTITYYDNSNILIGITSVD